MAPFLPYINRNFACIGCDGNQNYKRIGAAEARWAHNSKVLRSKFRFAILEKRPAYLSWWSAILLNLWSWVQVPMGVYFFLHFQIYPYSRLCAKQISLLNCNFEEHWTHTPKVKILKLKSATVTIPPSSVGRAQDS